MKYVILFTILSTLVISCSDDSILLNPINEIGHSSSLRGLYTVNEKVTWASGSNGVVKRTINNETWESFQDTTMLHLDFRDIHAFSKDEAIVMSSGDGCEMYKTKDGAQTWKLVYNNKTEGIFFDGMDFWDDKSGLAFSDPINGKLFIIKTTNGGDSWKKLNNLPTVLAGEASFAASGTTINCVGDSTVYIGTGGGELSRMFISKNRGKTWSVVNTKMRTGEASGIYSLAFLDEQNGILVGGNYLDSNNTENNCMLTIDGGNSWTFPETPPNGYRSCITFNANGNLIACGRTGIDLSEDGGLNWKSISKNGYYACSLQEGFAWVVGKNKIAKLEF